MRVKIKKLNTEAVIPTYSKYGDAGLDLTAVSDGEINPFGAIGFRTGLSIEIPYGYVGLIFPRSSVYKSTGRISNAVGVIDAGYRGEVIVNFDPSIQAVTANMEDMLDQLRAEPYKKGDKIAQLIIVPFPEIEFEEVTELSDSVRGESGFGSTGK